MSHRNGLDILTTTPLHLEEFQIIYRIIKLFLVPEIPKKKNKKNHHIINQLTSSIEEVIN